MFYLAGLNGLRNLLDGLYGWQWHSGNKGNERSDASGIVVFFVFFRMNAYCWSSSCVSLCNLQIDSQNRDVELQDRRCLMEGHAPVGDDP